ncbi:MAG TPA: MEKHLA domain-containing protein, partial [Pseudonocardiaceae bacterium]|nr:MEKHLA domain-containing protein [Pseudonocardiaceae bacterium]
MPQPDRSVDPEFAALLLDNHHKLVGTRLEPDGLAPVEAARWLYHEAPFGLLAHDATTDPVFVYANESAQHAFGYDWAEFTTLPSRLSAGPQDRAEREE